jgi:predicted 3-demethylubiquinone-9 3-methyltransferase (glyoxalase superfamily)
MAKTSQRITVCLWFDGQAKEAADSTSRSYDAQAAKPPDDRRDRS